MLSDLFYIGLLMQKKRLLKLAIIILFVFLVISLTFVAFGFPSREYEVFLCQKSITIKAEEFGVLNFYVPQGLTSGMKIEFSVSEGTIRHWVWASHEFESNINNVLLFMEENNLATERLFHEINEHGASGFSWSEGDPHCVDQMWDVFLYNKDPYDKEVQIKVSILRTS
jgi:hypothetical protein